MKEQDRKGIGEILQFLLSFPRGRMGDRQTGYWAGGGGEDVRKLPHPQPAPRASIELPIWTSGAPSVRTDGAFPAELSHQEERLTQSSHQHRTAVPQGRHNIHCGYPWG